MPRSKVPFCWLAVVATIVVNGFVLAQEYPVKPIRLVSSGAPGGSTDNYARILANELRLAWGKPVNVENRTGGTGLIAIQLVRQSPPDGYTLLYESNTGYVLGPLLHDPRPFDPLNDFVPISLAVRFPMYLVITPSIPAQTVSDFIAYARSKPKELNYASSGAGGNSHLAAEIFNVAVGISAVHVPYKGAAPGMQAVAAGEVQYKFDNIGVSQPLVLAGKLRGLAITGVNRSPAVPEVPTFLEAGVRGLEGQYVWSGLFGPARLPSAIASKLSAEIIRIMRSPEVGKRVLNDGYEVLANTPIEFLNAIREEVETASRIIREKGIKAQ